MRVFCYRSGEIGFGVKTPNAALELAKARNGKKLRDIIEINARHSKAGNMLLVPGVPEAEDDELALVACERFRELIEMRLEGKAGFPASHKIDRASNEHVNF